jgi:hypothetical protein
MGLREDENIWRGLSFQTQALGIEAVHLGIKEVSNMRRIEYYI